MNSDLELQASVRRYLDERSDVNHGELDVQVLKGVVTLTGKMRTDVEKWQIEDAIRGMPGVDSLANHTMVAPANSVAAINSDIARPWFPST